jgi:hypothetical protein
MKRILISLTVLLLLSCNEKSGDTMLPGKQAAEITRLEKENDSLRKIARRDTTIPPPHVADPRGREANAASAGQPKAGVHPISLHWLGWDKPGKVTVTPGTDNWYGISGGQQTSKLNYLRIEGKIRRISEKELEFDGTIETRTESNYEGKPCIKTGLQRFFGKGERTYYRLQNMDNCMGERVVDYVDIYPGTSGL